jgi:hypothetical protein
MEGHHSLPSQNLCELPESLAPLPDDANGEWNLRGPLAKSCSFPACPGFTRHRRTSFVIRRRHEGVILPLEELGEAEGEIIAILPGNDLDA